MWLVLLLILNIPASWAYYFIVKRPALGMEEDYANRHVVEHDKPVRKKLEEAGALKKPESEKTPKVKKPAETKKEEQQEAAEPDEQPTQGPTLDDLKDQAEEAKPAKKEPKIIR